LPDELNNMDGLEYYEQVSFMKGGILFADRVTTVSPRYAQEIQTPEFGCGLDGVVQTRAEDIVGLLNGVDTAVWNPRIDALLPAKYSATDLSGKRTCREELLKRCGMDPKFSGPVFGMICRLTEQKGVDLVLANQDFFLTQECRLIVLGSGEKRYEEALRALMNRAPTKIMLVAKLDEGMSHLIEAGSDFFVMPSLFEPCGLNQMYSQIYGTLPIVSRVGGLADTVIDADDEPAKGTGIMADPTAPSLRNALDRAAGLYHDRSRYLEVQQRAMHKEFSWKVASAGYETLYRESL
jgi:starch synthase